MTLSGEHASKDPDLDALVCKVAARLSVAFDGRIDTSTFWNMLYPPNGALKPITDALMAAEGNLLLRRQEIAGMLDLLGRVAHHLRNLPATKESDDIALASECETWVEAMSDV